LGNRDWLIRVSAPTLKSSLIDLKIGRLSAQSALCSIPSCCLMID
jgi:hypothetical protein